ncbi:unnamed protein product [Adineta steineri]|uniref:TTF-type domain-containing protein n=1 Tax=Adineta steineri TaxID=433720 RepID=A0A818ZEY7_9BILA|nr:unnamed protein product [Adineta steineri]CAF3768620.1 unnamed protein product [Adineta steineri]
MSEKNKLLYYFTKKSASHETSDIHHIGATDTDVTNINETIAQNELDTTLSQSSSSLITTSFDSSNQDIENSNSEQIRFMSATKKTTDNHDSLASSSQLNLFKRDPGRGPEAAKEFLLLGPYQPDIIFPTINFRHFCFKWYNVYKWLEFSEMTKKAYCFVCRLYYPRGKSDDAFVKNGYDNWSIAIQRFNMHQAAVSHKQANESYVNSIKNYENNMDVLKILNVEHKKKTLENRNYLKEIIRTIIFLAKQGLPFRGHREDNESLNKGNLLELLELRSLDNELIKKKLSILKYTHHSIQNELLLIIQQHILSEIVSEIKVSRYFSIMIDETSDIARHEQVSPVIRFTDDQFNVYERFLGFQRASDTSGQSLFDLLLGWLKKLNLDITYIVGQCYDGASSMRGERKGVASRMIQVVPTALYVHCNGHVLNLCLVDVSEANKHIRNNFGIVKCLYNFIEGSPKRHKVFEDLQKESGIVSISLKSLCDTRWTCRYESLKVISNRYSEILCALTLIETGDSFILLQVIKTFDFVFHIYMMSEIYLITHILSKFLQRVNLSLTDALSQVKITIDSLESLRNQHEFERIWNESMKICVANDIDEPCERRKRKVPLRYGGGDTNPVNSTVQDEYRVNSFYAVLDIIVTSIKERFDENYLHIIVLCEKLFLHKVFLVEDELKEIARFYNINYDDLRTEQRLYKIAFDEKQQWNLTAATKLFMQHNFHLSLPAMNQLLKILWTIPTNVCGCERSFSSLRRIKTYIRSTTGQERLSSLALINIEKDYQIDIDTIVTDFISKKDERKKIF